MGKESVCATCKKIIKKGMITEEGRKFCSKVCAPKPAKPKAKKNTCEFC